MDSTSPLFETFPLAEGVTLRNRVVMAPMTTWASNDDLTVSDEEIAYYRRRASGVGMVITGCTHVSPEGIGFTHEFASDDDRFLPGLKRLAEAAKSGGAKAIMQIFHAGNRALPELTPGGEIVSASALTGEPSPFAPCDIPARALTETEILAIVADFGAATRRAVEAGFDGVELHGAHGFLLQNFYSPLYNRRPDAWGGSRENRLRFPLAVVAEVKRVIAQDADRPFVLGYRVSPEEGAEGGLRMADAYALIDAIVAAGVDYIHASLSSVLDAKPIGGTDGQTIAELVVAHVDGRVPVIAAGQVRVPDQAETALARGLALVAVGQGLVMNPDWVELAQTGQAHRIATTLDVRTLTDIALPPLLWTVIDETKGWFAVSGSSILAHAEA
ncbi:NADH-dependent flavin oxidoreductase [Brevundimonas intermedia]|uniref:NADH-dependent flavin oxidoreductase n=1 Tax=Brevundimonas intermedia TaxID=74315 RepID=UPI0032084156